MSFLVNRKTYQIVETTKDYSNELKKRTTLYKDITIADVDDKFFALPKGMDIKQVEDSAHGQALMSEILAEMKEEAKESSQAAKARIRDQTEFSIQNAKAKVEAMKKQMLEDAAMRSEMSKARKSKK